MATARVNGVELYYEESGTGDCLVLTHGSWTDASWWGSVVARLAERYRVVVWDRRGHSRSQDGRGPGRRAEDAADLAGLIEHLADGPVHLAGSSYGGNVTLTLVASRPELVATAAVHEPPLFGLLEGTPDPALRAALAGVGTRLAAVRDLVATGAPREAAKQFAEQVALGPGAWDLLPDARRAVLVANASTFVDELDDETALSIDTAALAAVDVPILLTSGTESPVLFPAVIAELATLLRRGRVEVLEGAGHVPHVTHPDEWVTRLMAFHAAEGFRPAA